MATAIGPDTVTFDADLVRIGGIPVWNLSGKTGRDPATGVLLDGLNDRVRQAATGAFGKAASAEDWLSELAMEVDAAGSEVERRMALTPNGGDGDVWLPIDPGDFDTGPDGSNPRRQPH